MEKGEGAIIGKIVGGVFVFLILLTLVSGSMGTVDAGNVGVRTAFGAVAGEVQPGFYFKKPFIESVDQIDVQTQKEQTDAESASSDLQTVHATVAINFNVLPDKVTDLYQNIGTDYKSRVIDPAIQEAVKASTAKYTAEELITKRPQVQDDILASLTARLAPQFIKVSNVSVINFDFSATFNTAIEAKVTAEQNALAAKNKLEQVGYEAQQTIASAKAQAEAIKIQAQAINSQGGADYVQLQAIKAWKGEVPQYVGTLNSVPLINLGNK